MKSKLGYLLLGPLPNSIDATTSTLHIAALQTNEYDLQRFWAKAPDTLPSCTSDTESIQSFIDSNISRNDDRSYTARFPWKEIYSPLPTNQSICEKRTCSLVSSVCVRVCVCVCACVYVRVCACVCVNMLPSQKVSANFQTVTSLQ